MGGADKQPAKAEIQMAAADWSICVGGGVCVCVLLSVGAVHELVAEGARVPHGARDGPGAAHGRKLPRLLRTTRHARLTRPEEDSVRSQDRQAGETDFSRTHSPQPVGR